MKLPPDGLDPEDIAELSRTTEPRKPPPKGQANLTVLPGGEGPELDGSEGWLVGDGWELFVQVGKGDEVRLVHFADFDIKATGVSEGGEVPRTYYVRVSRKRQRDVLELLLPSATLANKEKMAIWLAGLGLTVAPPSSGMAWTTRILRRLESQDPTAFEVVTALGWDDRAQAFICHEGQITTDGMHPHGLVRPAPTIQEWAPYRYGMADGGDVLREILTFQEQRDVAVFGSWLVAVLLKPQIKAAAFPHAIVEGLSGSGKTNGFYGIAVRFTGRLGGGDIPTPASMRNALAAHKSGIVWLDDPESIQDLVELMRQGASGGAKSKMAEDNTGKVMARLEGSCLVSAEAVALVGASKAMVNRVVRMRASKASNRRSLHDPEQWQWADVLDFHQRHPDLSEYAGWFVQECLKRASMLEGTEGLAPTGDRHDDNVGILRACARILADIVGDGYEWIASEVDAWAGEQVNPGDESYLTLALLPEILRRTEYPQKPASGDRRWPVSPVLMRPDPQEATKTKGAGRMYLWVNLPNVASWEKADKNGRVDEQQGSIDSLMTQADALGITAERTISPKLMDNRQTVKYRRVPYDLGRRIIDRAMDSVHREISGQASGQALPVYQGYLELGDMKVILSEEFIPSE